jgi:ribosomal protein S12
MKKWELEKQNRLLKAELEAMKWNHANLIGTKVKVHLDNKEELITYTRNIAQVLGERAVIWVQGIPGCYDLDRVEAAND